MRLASRRRRAAVIAAAAVLVLVLAWVVASWVVVSRPDVDDPVRADAVVVLGDPVPDSLVAAERLLADGVTDQLVISAPLGDTGRPAECDRPPDGVRVTCFEPDPSTTRGEAQEIGRLARERGWDDVVVVTWTEHISRSRYLIGRCFDGDLAMVAYDDPPSLPGALEAWVYESGAFLKAAAQRGC